MGGGGGIVGNAVPGGCSVLGDGGGAEAKDGDAGKGVGAGGGGAVVGNAVL